MKTIKTIKKIVFVLTAIALLMGCVSVAFADVVDSGTCGERVNYTIDSNGLLTITGMGDMSNYKSNQSPFYKNDTIKKVIMDKTITSIGANVFRECINLKEFVFPEKLLTIGNDAFNGAGLENNIDLQICYKLNTIGDTAFANNENLSAIELPDSLQKIGHAAFSGTKISDITIPKNVDILCLDGTIVPSKMALEGMDHLKTLTFADGMKKIPNGAAKGNSSIESVIIPDSVEMIGRYAFCGCSALTMVTISSSSSLATISELAFFGCNALKDLYFPEKLNTIGNRAFSGAGLESVDLKTKVESIGDEAFKDTNIATIELPDSLCKIGTAAFSGTMITDMEIPKNVTDMCINTMVPHGSALEGMDYLETLTFADGMKKIPIGAAKGNNALESVIIPDSVEKIGSRAFEGCSALTSVRLSSQSKMMIIEDIAFYGCNALKDFFFVEELLTIGDWAFCNAGLESVKLNNKIKSIGISAFENTSIKSINLPVSLETIGARAFAGTSIEEITIPKNVTSMYGYHSYGFGPRSALDGMVNLESVVFSDGRRTLPKNAVLNCSQIETVYIYDCFDNIDGLDLKAMTTNQNLNVVIRSCEEINEPDEEIKYGDVDGNGQILADDARLALRASAQLEKLDETQTKAADVDGNGQVLADDARQILRYSAKLQNSFDKAA